MIKWRKSKIFLAAHCIFGKGHHKKLQAEEIIALPGKYNFGILNESDVVRTEIDEIIIHEDWDTKKESYDADLAVLLFKNPVNYTNFIRPICLPTSSSSLSGGTVAGWGLAYAKRDTENILLSAKMNTTLISNESCRDETMNIASERSFCSKGLNETGTCSGDSGLHEFLFSNFEFN